MEVKELQQFQNESTKQIWKYMNEEKRKTGDWHQEQQRKTKISVTEYRNEGVNSRTKRQAQKK